MFAKLSILRFFLSPPPKMQTPRQTPPLQEDLLGLLERFGPQCSQLRRVWLCGVICIPRGGHKKTIESASCNPDDWLIFLSEPIAAAFRGCIRLEGRRHQLCNRRSVTWLGGSRFAMSRLSRLMDGVWNIINHVNQDFSYIWHCRQRSNMIQLPQLTPWPN